MTITKPCIVGLVWQLSDAQGEPIAALDEITEFFFGGDDLLPKIEEVLDGRDTGFEATLHLEPEHAFGEYNPALVFFEERRRLPDNIEAGMQFDGVPPGAATTGMPQDAVYIVTEVYPEHVVLDGNHPLAGIALRIHLTVHSVRAATDEEVEAGTVGAPLLSVGPSAPPGTALH